MPKPEEFEVHTMGGGNVSGGNAIQNTPSSFQSSFSQSQKMISPQKKSPIASSLSKSSSIGGVMQGVPSKPFTGAPVSGVGSGIGGANVQTMAIEDELSGKSSSKLLKIFIGVFVGIILVGGAVFGVYFLKDKSFVKQYFPDDLTEESVEKNLGINDQIAFSTSEVKEEIEQPEPVKTTKMRYSNDLLNYLSIDTESETILSDIQNELNIIRLNLPSHNFSEPITFIVTNKQNKPISFSDFTVYSDMGISSDILLALDDRFEIYAYNDFSAGVRFGFRVDVKNAEALNKALDANAAMIPPATLIFFKNFTINPDLELKFNNGSYEKYTVKYINLNETQTSSVDYIVDEDRWVLGTSQKTLRAIMDKLDKTSSSNNSKSTSENVYISDRFLESLANCSPNKETFKNSFTDQDATREIIGMVNGKCSYIEEAPDSNSGIITKTICKYSDESRLQLVKYYKKLKEGGNVEFSVETDANGNTIGRTIVGGEEIVGFSLSDILAEECTIETNVEQVVQNYLESFVE